MGEVSNTLNHVFFNAGDTVILKNRNLRYAPIMQVKTVQKFKKDLLGNGETRGLIGILCFWFTSEGMYQECIFSSKDLKHYEI